MFVCAVGKKEGKEQFRSEKGLPSGETVQRLNRGDSWRSPADPRRETLNSTAVATTQPHNALSSQAQAHLKLRLISKAGETSSSPTS